MPDMTVLTTLPAAATNEFAACRILYSTQSGRAKACARRTARIISEYVELQNGKGTTFDDDLWLQSSVEDFACQMRESNALLVLFVSTTGDGEQTVRLVVPIFFSTASFSIKCSKLCCFARIPFSVLGSNCKFLSSRRTIMFLLYLFFFLIYILFLRFRLQKSLPTVMFQGVRFCIFNLGDRAYGPQKFCAAGRKLTVRLRQLGAILQTDPGYGDDGTPNGGVFADLDHFIQTKLLLTLGNNKQPAAIASFAVSSTSFAPPYRVTVTNPEHTDRDSAKEEWQLDAYATFYCTFFQKQCPFSAYQYDSSSQRTSGSSSTPLLGRLAENKRLTAVDWEQNTRHLRLEVSTAATGGLSDDTSSSESQLLASQQEWSLNSLPYRAGDVAAILPSNSAKEVDAFLKVLPSSLQEIADRKLSINFDPACSSDVNRFPGVGYAFWPFQCSLRGWLSYCADIHALPEREDLRALASYCSDYSSHGRDQRDKLISLSETNDSALYVDYVLREKRSWIDVLYDFDSLRDIGSLLTVESLLGLLSPLRPREFSIASSPTRDWLAKQRPAHAKQEAFGVELCVAVVEGTTRLGRPFHGLCSHYLCHLKPSDCGNGSLVRLWIRPGSFHGLPLELTFDAQGGNCLRVPILCVGAGTGVAPLRSLIHEREAVLRISEKLPCSSEREEGLQELERDNILVFGCRKKTADFYYQEEWKSLQHSGRVGLLVAFSRDQWHKIYVQQILGSAECGGEQLVRHIIDKKGAIYVAGGPKMARAVKETIFEFLSKEMDGGEKETQHLLIKLQQAGHYSVEAWN